MTSYLRSVSFTGSTGPTVLDEYGEVPYDHHRSSHLMIMMTRAFISCKVIAPTYDVVNAQNNGTYVLIGAANASVAVINKSAIMGYDGEVATPSSTPRIIKVSAMLPKGQGAAQNRIELYVLKHVINQSNADPSLYPVTWSHN